MNFVDSVKLSESGFCVFTNYAESSRAGVTSLMFRQGGIVGRRGYLMANSKNESKEKKK